MNKSLTIHRQFQFIIAGILKKKPILAANAPSRSKAGGPFVNPDPEEVVTDLGSTHRLLVNKYGIFRPMTVIPTKHYALQTDDLDISDVNAAWSVLKAFETPSLIIYNCGINAGSSQGHKHTQVFPLPAHKLWPSKAISCDGKVASLPLFSYCY
jgi:ATP adenylyltransferase